MKTSFKTVIIIIGIIILVSWYISSLLTTISTQKESIQVLEVNTEQLLVGMRVLRTDSGMLVAKVNELTFSRAEIEYYNSELVKRLESAKVKIKNLESVIELSVSSKDTVTVLNRDTLIQNLSFRTFSYNTKWYQVKGIQDSLTTKLEIGCYHDISIANEVMYKGWWIFKKAIKNEVTVIVSNPKDTIEKIQSFYISEKRKKR